MIRNLVLALLVAASTPAIAGNADIDYKEMLSSNNANLTHLAIGMTKAQVVGVMKSFTTTLHSVQYTNPVRIDALQKDGETYAVLFYLTRAHPPFTPIRESQATSVVLKNGVVVGWGPAAMQSLR